jgi:hypothetical protein
MKSVATIGLDIAKSVFQVHGVDADGNRTGISCQTILQAYGRHKELHCTTKRRVRRITQRALAPVVLLGNGDQRMRGRIDKRGAA